MTEFIDGTKSGTADGLAENDLKRAEEMFEELRGTDENILRYSIEMSYDAVDVDEVQKGITNARMAEMEDDHEEELTQKDFEIEKLRAQLAAHMNKTVEEAKEELQEDEDSKVKSPIIQKITLNGKEHTVLICHFQPNSGRIGIKFKRFKDGFFVTGVLPDSQAANYAGLNRGLLMFEVVSWSPLQKMGMTIPAQKASTLVKRIMVAFNEGSNVTIKFIVPPTGVDRFSIQQHIIRPKHYNLGL